MSSAKQHSSKTQILTVGSGGELHQTASAPDGRMTTNHGVPISDNQNSLKAGRRGAVAARRLRPAREDPAFRSRAHPGADRPCARLGGARLFRADRVAGRIHARQDADRGRRKDRGVRPLLDRGRRRGLGRHAARRARLRGQVLHQGGQLGPGRQQHPGVLHPGRDQVPRPDPRGEDGGRPRLSAGGQRARHVLGLHRPDARIAPT